MTKVGFLGFNLTLRWLAALFLFVNLVALIFIPITPDEISRLTIAGDWLAGGVYDFSWPPMLILLNVVVKYFGGQAYSVRLLFLVIEISLLMLLSTRVVFSKNWWCVLVFPYLALILNIASPQGLMVVLLPLLVYAAVQNKPKEAYIISFVIYLVNPTCMLILPAAAMVTVIFLDENEVRLSYLYAILSAFFSILGIAYFLSIQGQNFMPTLTSNGPLNLYLGNNPSLISFRGGADGVEWLSYDTGQYMSAVVAFLFEQPGAFFQNFLYKIIFWLAPFDQFRSGIGGAYYFVLFSYVAMVQLICYYVFFRRIKNNSNAVLMTALHIFFIAWLAYVVFFVRLRYRIPFDLLLFIVAFTELRGFKSKKTKLFMG